MFVISGRVAGGPDRKATKDMLDVYTATIESVIVKHIEAARATTQWKAGLTKSLEAGMV